MFYKLCKDYVHFRKVDQCYSLPGQFISSAKEEGKNPALIPGHGNREYWREVRLPNTSFLTLPMFGYVLFLLHMPFKNVLCSFPYPLVLFARTVITQFSQSLASCHNQCFTCCLDCWSASKASPGLVAFFMAQESAYTKNLTGLSGILRNISVVLCNL